MGSLPRWARRAPLRLAIVVLLSLLVGGACYGVSVSPVGQALVSTSGGRPGSRGPATPAVAPSTSTSTGAPADTAASAATAP